MIPRLAFVTCFVLFSTAAAASVVAGPERLVGEHNLGAPATHDRMIRIASNGQGFMTSFDASGHGYFMPLGSDGQPTRDFAVWSGTTAPLAMASDGENYLALRPVALERDVPALRVTLLDAEASILRNLTVAGTGSLALGERAIVWTGRDYLVSWLDIREQIVRAVRLDPNGDPIGAPFEVVRTFNYYEPPRVAFDGVFTYVVVVDRPDASTPAHLMRIGHGNDIVKMNFGPLLFTVHDFVASNGSLFILAGRSDNPTVLYTLPAGAETAIDWGVLGHPRLVQFGDGVLVFGARGTEIVAQEVSASAQTRGALTGIVDRRSAPSFDDFESTAASNGHVVVLGWTETWTRDANPVISTFLDGSLRSQADGKPDGRLLTRGASARTSPAAAAAGDAILTVWREQLEGKGWIRGNLAFADGSRRTIDVSRPAAGGLPGSPGPPALASNGSAFFVVWPHADELRTVISLRGRIIRLDGTAGEEFEIVASGVASRASVAAHPNGFVVVWSTIEATNAGYAITSKGLGRRYGANGEPLDAEPRLLVPALPGAWDPAIAAAGDRLLLVWSSGTKCSRSGCALSGYLDLRGRVLDWSLSPQSSDFVIAERPESDEIGPVIASSEDGWLVAWTSHRRAFAGHFVDYSGIGHAVVSSAGFVGEIHEPVLDDPAVRRRNPAVTWTGLAFVLAYEVEFFSSAKSQYAVAALHTSRSGYRLSREETIVVSAFSPALVTNSDATVLFYARSAPELQFGAAPQIFSRQLTILTSRQRAVRR